MNLPTKFSFWGLIRKFLISKGTNFDCLGVEFCSPHIIIWKNGSGETYSEHELISLFIAFTFCAFFAIFRNCFLTYLKSVACEAVSKSGEKFVKNRILRIVRYTETTWRIGILVRRILKICIRNEGPLPGGKARVRMRILRQIRRSQKPILQVVSV